jgi:flagellar hook protein FlgE
MFSGVSGLRVHQTKMDVIANNIANVNTVGYKSSRVTFRDAFYQRIQGASGPNPDIGRAGTNPMQIGLGTSIGSIDTIMTQGLSQRTDRSLDIMIQGSGFFIVSDAYGTYFTRAGNIDLDSQMNMHINGMQLMGWDVVKNSVTGKYEVEKGPVKPLNLGGDKQNVPPEPTSIIDMIGNLNVDDLNDRNQTERTITFLDTVGNPYTVDVLMTFHNQPVSDVVTGFWTYEFKTMPTGRTGTTPEYAVLAYPNGDRTNPKQIAMHVGDQSNLNGISGTQVNPGELLSALVPKGILLFNTDGKLIGADTLTDTLFTAPIPLDPNTGIIPTPTIGPDGNVISPLPPVDLAAIRTLLTSPQSVAVYLAPAEQLDPPATFGKPSIPELTVDYGDITIDSQFKRIGQIDLNMRGLTQWGGKKTDLKFLEADGNRPGTLQDLAIGPDGKITGRYSNGMTRLLGQIPTAQFQNAAGLEKVGSNLFVVTTNSGPFDGVGDEGDIMGGALEMSNVDLSQEFTDMITTQRGFQANSRIITVSDDMLQELVNLKR